MTVPTFKKFLKPTLWAFKDKQVHTNNDISELNANYFKLDENDLKDLIGDGGDKNRPKYIDRTYWAITYLFQSGLLNRTSPGKYMISNAGLSVIEENPEVFDEDYLLRFPSFRRFKGVEKTNNDPVMILIEELVMLM